MPDLPIYHDMIIIGVLYAASVTLAMTGRARTALAVTVAALLFILTACSTPPTAPDPYQDVPWDQLPAAGETGDGRQETGTLYRGDF